MQLKNKIVNYYVALPSQKGDSPRVFRSPVTIDDKTARTLINTQLTKHKQPGLQMNFPLLHVCYDFDSGIIYVPNSHDFSKDQVAGLLPAAKIRISKDFGGYSGRPPIEGSPFSSIRVRSIDSFSYARKVISEHYKGKEFKDIPVIEAFLKRMPRTLKTLPPEFSHPEQYIGGYVSPKQVDSVSFLDEIDLQGNKRKEPKFLLTQKAPFILINTSRGEDIEDVTASDKEWAVLEGYRNYLYDSDVVKEKNEEVSANLTEFADLYALKRLMYLGWPFEAVCSYLIGDTVMSFGSLLKSINRLMMAADSLTKDGYKNPAQIPYYISMKIDERFFKVWNFSSLIKEDGTIDYQSQHPNFMLVDFDEKNGSIIIRTPVFIPQSVCKRVFKPVDSPFIVHYNPVVNKIDVKTDERTFESAKKEVAQIGKLNYIIRSGLDEDKKKTVEFRAGDIASGKGYLDPTVTTLRKISDYPLAYDFIKKVCKRYNVEFKDVDVLVGPLELLMGQAGTRGAFMDEKMFAKNKMPIPFKLTNGVYISPPIIMVDSILKPSYAEQTDTLSHEYAHNLYGITHPEYEVTYKFEDPKNQKDEYRQWFTYFKDPSEIEAHKVNIEYELGIGKSYDEIVRDKVGGAITLENYPTALKFGELVKEVMEKMEKEKEVNEEPTGER